MKNYKAKVLAIFFAILVWIFVISSGEHLRKFTDSIPVQAFNLTEGLAVDEQETWSPISVYLNAPDEVFKTLKIEDFSAYVDLKGLGTDQEYELPINLTAKNAEVRVVKIEPTTLRVKLQALATRELQVKTDVQGELSSQFKLGVITIAPQMVAVSGAENKVKQAVSAVAILNLTGNEEADIDRQVTLQAVNDSGEIVTGLSFTPAEVNLTAKLERLVDEKVVSIKADLGSGVAKAGYWLEKVEITPATITVIGNPDLISKTENIKTELINIEGLSSTLERSVKLILPTGLSVDEGESSTVLVKISVTQQESSREVFATLEPANLEPTLTVSKFSPASLQIKVKGSFEALKALDESKVKAVIDLSGKTAGVHKIEIPATQLNLPYPLQLDNYTPQTIEITLSLAEHE